MNKIIFLLLLIPFFSFNVLGIAVSPTNIETITEKNNSLFIFSNKEIKIEKPDWVEIEKNEEKYILKTITKGEGKIIIREIGDQISPSVEILIKSNQNDNQKDIENKSKMFLYMVPFIIVLIAGTILFIK